MDSRQGSWAFQSRGRNCRPLVPFIVIGCCAGCGGADSSGNPGDPPSTTLPAAPTQLRAGPVTDTSITLRWSDNASKETGFENARKQGSTVAKPTPSPIRLLIAESSGNRAHEIDSILRDAGIATRPEIFGDLAAADARHDLIVMSSGFEHLEQVLPGLREAQPEIPIIFIEQAGEPRALTRGMAIGATDVVLHDDDERLLHVVRRELGNLSERRRLCRTERALDEAERRCQLVLANSSAAIAYVHEGMHNHANRDYFELFGAGDADEMLGVPLMDLIDPDFAQTFKGRGEALPRAGRRGLLRLRRPHYRRRAGGRAHDAGESRVRGRKLPAGAGAVERRGAGSRRACRRRPRAVDRRLSATRHHPPRGLGEMDTVVEEIHAALTAGAEDAEVARIAHHRFAMIVTAEGSDQIEALAERRCRDSAASTTRSRSSVSSRSTSSSSTASHVEEIEDRDAVTGLSRQLQSNGKLIIVPMVESATVLSALWQAGATYIQGHYLQEPSTEMDYDFSHDD